MSSSWEVLILSDNVCQKVATCSDCLLLLLSGVCGVLPHQVGWPEDFLSSASSLIVPWTCHHQASLSSAIKVAGTSLVSFLLSGWCHFSLQQVMFVLCYQAGVISAWTGSVCACHSTMLMWKCMTVCMQSGFPKCYCFASLVVYKTSEWCCVCFAAPVKWRGEVKGCLQLHTCSLCSSFGALQVS